MKAKPRAERSHKPKKTTATGKPTRAYAVERDRWHMNELPSELQAELRDRLEQAKRGESLIPFDKAVEEAERMADEIVVILTRSDTRRPTE